MEHVCGCGANGAPRIVQGNDFTLRVRVLRSVLRDGIAQREDIGLEGCTGVSASLVSRTGKRIPLAASVNDGRLLVDVDETVPVGAYGLEVKGKDANGSDWRSMRRPGEFLRVVGSDGEATGLPDGGVYDVSADVAYSSVSAELAGRLNDAAKEASEAAGEAREAAAGASDAAEKAEGAAAGALSRLTSVVNASREMGKTEESRKAGEEERKAGEEQRKANEEERKASEEERKAGETARQEAEKKREEAEAAREAAAARATVEVRRSPSGRLYSGTTYAEASQMLADGKRVDYTFPDGTMLDYPETFHGAHLSGDHLDYIVSAETYMQPHSSKPQISFLIHHEDDSFNVINSPYFYEDGSISGYDLADNSVTEAKLEEGVRKRLVGRVTVEVTPDPDHGGRFIADKTSAEVATAVGEGKEVEYHATNAGARMVFRNPTVEEMGAEKVVTGIASCTDDDWTGGIVFTHYNKTVSVTPFDFLANMSVSFRHLDSDLQGMLNGGGRIGEEDLADNAVTADKIADQAVTEEKLSQDLRQRIDGANAPLLVTLTGYREEPVGNGKKASFTASVAAEGVSAAVLGGTSVQYRIDSGDNNGFAAMREAGLSSVTATPSGCAVKDGGGASVLVSVLGMEFTHSGTEAVCDMPALSLLE